MPVPIYEIIVPADYKSAVIDYLRSRSEMTAVVSAEHIVGRVPDLTGDPKFNWLAIVAAGGRDSIYNMPLTFPHLDAHCMGVNGYESMRIWRTMKGVLDHASYRMDGFIAQGCRVDSIRVGLPYEMPDIGVKVWDKRIAPMYLTVNEVPT
jgi:hypothetical protein